MWQEYTDKFSKSNKILYKLYESMKLVADNKKYCFTKMLSPDGRRKIRNKLWAIDYRYVLQLTDCINIHTNLIDFECFKKQADVGDTKVREFRSKLRKNGLIKRLKIKWAVWRYLNPILTHTGQTESIAFLYEHFINDTLNQYA